MSDVTIGNTGVVIGWMGDVSIGIIGGVMGSMGDMTPLGSSVGSWDGWVTRHHWDHRWGHGINV